MPNKHAPAGFEQIGQVQLAARSHAAGVDTRATPAAATSPGNIGLFFETLKFSGAVSVLGKLSRRAWTGLMLGRLVLLHRLFGIGYLANELSNCPNHLIARVLRMYG